MIFGFIRKIVFLLLLGYGLYWFSPYRTVQSLTAALENEDPAQVAQYVDFDALKANMTVSMAQKIAPDAAQKDPSISGIIAKHIAGAFVDSIVSPASMIPVLKDKTRRDQLGLSTSMDELAMRGSWQDTSHFVLHNAKGQATAILTREGLDWRITSLKI